MSLEETDLKQTVLMSVARVLIEHEDKCFAGATVTLNIDKQFQLSLGSVKVGFYNFDNNFIIEADKLKI